MPVYFLGKRTLDIGGALVGLLLIAPLTPFIVAAIVLETRGPALVRLTRVSGGRAVYVFKFRTMIDGAHELKIKLASMNERKDGPFFKMSRDPRVTRVGRVLRRFRLDEFPQLVNVLRGELSLVGPRPHEPEEVILYPDEHKHLLLVRAGVTGLSQVSGASSLPFLKELELDGAYVKRPSLFLDLKIIARTLKIIFTDPTAV